MILLWFFRFTLSVWILQGCFDYRGFGLLLLGYAEEILYSIAKVMICRTFAAKLWLYGIRQKVLCIIVIGPIGPAVHVG